MAVMNKMRERMTVIMIIIIVAFLITIVFSWGGGGVDTFMKDKNTVGVVNGQEISIQDFYKVYNRMLEQYRDAGMEIDTRTSEMVLQQTWESMVNQVLWDQKVEKLKIDISDEELFYHLENNPPQVLMTQPAFMTDGQFDYQKYLDMLHNPQGDEWAQIEAYMRTQILPYEKLNNLITSSVVVDEQEIYDRFVKNNVMHNITYVAAPVRLVPDSLCPVYEEDIVNYYENNTGEYSVDEKRYIRFAYWEKIPSAEDTAAVLRDFEDIRLRVRDGESYDDLSAIFTELQDEAMIGELGWFSKKDIREEYADAVFLGEKDDILEPVVIDNEFHLIKVNDIRKRDGLEERNISLIVRRIDPADTYDFLAMEADAFTYDAADYGFEKALENSDAAFDSTKSGFKKEFPYFMSVGYLPSLARWAFNSKVNDVSRVFESEDAFVVAQLYKIDESGIRPLADVEKQVERVVLGELKKEISEEIISESYHAVMNGSDPDELSLAGLEKKTVEMKMANPPYPFNRSEIFPEIVNKISPGEICRPFLVKNYGWVFVRLNSSESVDEDIYTDRKADLRETILKEKQNAAFEQWLEDMKKDASIKDFRPAFNLN